METLLSTAESTFARQKSVNRRPGPVVPSEFSQPIFDGDPVQSPNLLYQIGLIVSVQLNRNRDLLEGGITTVSARRSKDGYCVTASLRRPNGGEILLLQPLHIPENGYPTDEWHYIKTWLQTQLTKPEKKNCSPSLSANT